VTGNERLEEELRADANVIRALRERGDIETIVRPVDVHFVGKTGKVAALCETVKQLGWRIFQPVQSDCEKVAIDIQRDQTTDVAALRQLTETALKIASDAGVEYDGWRTSVRRRPN
jgi:Regulator of ribonuclease activity B